MPFNIQTGTDRNNDTNNNDRPVGVGRDTGVGFSYASLDLRVKRQFHMTERFKLEGTADMFNLINKFNVADVNVLWTNAGQPTASFDPRQFQFGLKLTF